MSSRTIQRLTAIRENAKRYSEESKIAEDRSQYQQLLSELTPLAQRLESISLGRAILSKNLIDVPVSDPPGKNAAREIATLRVSFAENPGSIIDTGATKSRKALLNRVTAIADGWHAQALEAWRDFIAKLTPGLDKEVLRILEGIPNLSRTVQEVRKGLEELSASVAQLPKEESRIDGLRSVADRTRGVWSSLGGGDIQKEVIDFLRAAGSAGADLGQLNETVRIWLRKHGIVDRFVVTMRSRISLVNRDRS